MNNLFANVEIKGSLSFSQELLMEGRIEGDVTSSAPFIIGEQGFIKGTVKTRSVIVHGHVEGDITVQERCEVKASATVVGNITAATFSIEEGATFCGRAQVRQTVPATGNSLKHQRAA